MQNYFGYASFRSTERLLELLLFKIQALEILFRRLKEWLFVELVPVLVLDFTSITKICHRCLLLIVCGVNFCMSFGSQMLVLQ